MSLIDKNLDGYWGVFTEDLHEILQIVYVRSGPDDVDKEVEDYVHHLGAGAYKDWWTKEEVDREREGGWLNADPNVSDTHGTAVNKILYKGDRVKYFPIGGDKAWPEDKWRVRARKDVPAFWIWRRDANTGNIPTRATVTGEKERPWLKDYIKFNSTDTVNRGLNRL